MKRIRKELQELEECPERWFLVHSNASDPSKWVVHMLGPPDSPYADGVFVVHVSFPADYPFKPCRAVYATPVYHPGISPTGGYVVAQV